MIACVLVVVCVGAGTFGAKCLLDRKGDAPNNESLEALGSDGDQDIIAVDLSRDTVEKQNKDISKYVLVSSFADMGLTRQKLTGMEEAVSIPMAGDQEWIDKQRDSDMPDDVLFDVLDKKLGEWNEEFSKLKGNKLEAAVRQKVREEIMRNPVFGDMMAQAFLTYPQVARQNPWLVEFKEKMDESFARTEGLIGLDAWIHYESKKAEESQDFSKLLINTKSDEKTGAYEYFYDAGRIAELFDEFFEFEGRREMLQSVRNWHLPMQGDAALMRTSETPEQENKPTYVFTHYTKMRKVSIKLGFNALDRRVELFGDVPVTETVEKTTPPSQVNVPENPTTPPSTPEPIPTTPDEPEPTPTPDKPEPKLYKATVNHVILNEDGSQAADQSKAPETVVKTGLKDGESWPYTAPNVGGYTANPGSVTLTIQGVDAAATIYYSPIPKPDEPEPVEYDLTVVYQIEDGQVAAPPSVLESHPAGYEYGVPSPVVTGYVPDRVIVKGTMPDHDVTEVVVYRRQDGNGVKDPEDDPEQNEGYDPGIGDNVEGDQPGDAALDIPASDDKVNGGDYKPEENVNPDGADVTKPATPPIVEGSSDMPVQDGTTGGLAAGSGENNGSIDDSDPVMSVPRGESTPQTYSAPADGYAEAAPADYVPQTTVAEDYTPATVPLDAAEAPVA